MTGLHHNDNRWLLSENKGLREQLANERKLREEAERKLREKECE